MIIIVPATTLPDGSIGPDLTGLDAHLGYTLDPGGETYTVTMPEGWRHPDHPNPEEVRLNAIERSAPALALASRLAVTPLLPEETLTEAELTQLAPLYDAWAPDTNYAVGDVAAYEDGAGPPLWECRQAHTSQAGWEPPNVLALWQRYRGSDTPGEVPEWAIATPYAVGDEVTYQGQTYRCLQAHTSQPGWTPPAVPSLWTLIS